MPYVGGPHLRGWQIPLRSRHVCLVARSLPCAADMPATAPGSLRNRWQLPGFGPCCNMLPPCGLLLRPQPNLERQGASISEGTCDLTHEPLPIGLLPLYMRAVARLRPSECVLHPWPSAVS